MKRAARLLIKRLWLFILPICLANQVFGQASVSGTVIDSDDSSPLIGVNVVIKGTSTGTITDLDGKYTVDAPANAILVFSYTGYANQEIPVNGQTQLDVLLSSATSVLDEVVVVGYSRRQKADVTGAVTTVNQDFLDQQPAGSVTKALQGAAAGVTVVNTATPGANAEVRIRGLGTINGNEPLWVVDGVFDAEIPPPSQIESIQVLKDASATAIYGARGANGVILVTTKTGKAGQKPEIQFSVRTGAYAPTAKFDILTDPVEIGQMLWLQQYNDFQLAQEDPNADPNAVFTPTHLHFRFPSNTEPIVELNDFLFPNGARDGDPSSDLSLYDQRDYPITRMNTQGTDWLEEVYQPGLIQDYNLSVIGGGQAMRYGFHANYYTEEAQFIGSGYDRYAIRSNVDADVTNWLTVGQRLGGSVELFRGYRGNNSRGLLKNMMEASPLVPLFDEGGNWAGDVVGGTQNFRNQVGLLERQKDNFNRELTLSGNFHGTVRPGIEGLSVTTLFGYNVRSNKSTNARLPEFESRNGARFTELSNGNSSNLGWNWSNTINYKTSFSDIHSLDLLVGYEARRNTFDFNTASRGGFFSTDINYLVLNAGEGDQLNSGSRGESATTSIFGRLYYDYNGRYLLDATLRRDGSSIFVEDNRFGVFPALSLGWKVSGEEFMTGTGAWLSFLKLRAGWGQSGNDRTANVNNQFTLFSQNLGSSFYAIDGSDNNITQGFQSSNYGNPDAKWETTTTTNFALDATLFGSLDLTVDVWQKLTSDMLFQVQIPAVVGRAGVPSVNIGDMENKGIDVTLDYSSSAFGNALKYNVALTFSRYRNKVTKLSNNEDEVLLGSSLRGATYTQTESGRSFPEFFGYMIDGIFQTQTEADAHPTNGTYNRPGNLIVRDIDGDGEITPDDRTYIGNPHPDFTSGLRVNLEFKGFDLAATFYASVGHDIANYLARFRHYGLFDGPKSERRLKESWGSPFLDDNVNATLPRAFTSTAFEQNVISEVIEDGSYLRLQNLQLGYNLPESTLRIIGIKSARIYLMGTNLFTITGYSGLDPELPNNWSPDGASAAINRGIDIGAWPISTQYLAGLNFTF